MPTSMIVRAGTTVLAINPEAVRSEERWALLIEVKATFGGPAAKRLAEKLGVVVAGWGSGAVGVLKPDARE